MSYTDADQEDKQTKCTSTWMKQVSTTVQTERLLSTFEDAGSRQTRCHCKRSQSTELKI